MAIGRISGPLLAQNLFRDNVPLSFYNVNSSLEQPVLHLDVTNGRIGIKQDTPLYELDVNGTVNAKVLRVVATTPGSGVGTIGKIQISTNTISSVVGPVNISPQGGDDINLYSNTTVFGDLHATGNITADGDIGLGNVPTDRLKITAEVASDIIPALDNTFNIGGADASWAGIYANKINANVLTNAAGPIQINPAAGLLEINGDIRASGRHPIGTAPVVTNILYVTMDGDDTNDGAAMDPSRACRTISGAVRSPLYVPGTAIKVAPGRYYEENPILMQPYTSIIGSDLRTTFVEPINKTQDLFHVQSGCYIAQMQMSNGRSGLLPIENASGFNRGAYATAFPPSVNGEKIDVFHSPYIQNCTNQSGPWLKDGTMFVPNQTVQIPKAVGSGSWPIGTSTIVVSLTTGTIAIGDNINNGPQNTGFFDARTLILANKSFIQEQTINYINSNIATATTGSIWLNFSYARAKCFRDVGIILENLSYDTAFGGNEKSVESGKAYYNGVISLIAGQERQTIAAINYINSLTQKVITNTSATTIGAVTNPQQFNRNLKNGSIAGPGFANNISIVTGIITSGPDLAPATYKSQGPDSYIISAETLLQANRRFIQDELTAYIDNTYSSINYNTAKCKRDLDLIVDAIGFDLIFPTTNKSQSNFAGLQYWNQGSYTGQIINELSTTTNAIRFVSSLAQEVVQNITSGARYQNTATQITNIPQGSESEAIRIASEFGLILDIILNGTVGVTDRIVPNGSTTSTTTSVWNAYNSLLANKSYIQSEAVAWVEANKTAGFAYDQAKCARDVGYMVDSVAFDLIYGGNKQAIQSGVYYYSYTPGDSAIKNEVPQTLYAYNTLTNIVIDLVRNIPIRAVQTKVPQVFYNSTATSTEATQLSNFLADITNIITNGPTASLPKVPIGLTKTTNSAELTAFQILQANKSFIREEVVARVNKEYFKQYSYDRDKCYRDTGLIVDAVVQDLLFTTSSQATFAGLQYWNQSSTAIPGQTTTTTNALTYMRDLCMKIVMNDASVPRFSTGTQLTSVGGIALPSATLNEVAQVQADFNVMLDIITNGTAGVTDKIVPNGITKSLDRNVKQAYDLLRANRAYIQQEVVAWVDYNKTVGWNYDRVKCERDAGYIVDSISFDILYGGNKQAVQSGVYYYGFDAGSTAIYGQSTGTIAAFNFIRSIIPTIAKGLPATGYQTTEQQVFGVETTNTSTIAQAVSKVDIITNIIANGPSVANSPSPMPSLANTATFSSDVLNAVEIIHANRKFIQAETVAYVNQFFAFDYNRDSCKRDAGYIVDAVAYDLVVGGNTKSIEAGLGYWIGNKNYVSGEVTQTVAAITRAKNIALDIISNKVVQPSTGNGSKQIINSFFANGHLASQYIIRNFNIIADILQNGPSAVPEQFVGFGLFAATGISNNDTKYPPKVTSVQPFTYDQNLCRRDSGYVIDGVYYDIALGTNYNAVTCGIAYTRGIASVQVLRDSELTQTRIAFNYLKEGSKSLMSGNSTAVGLAEDRYNDLINILDGSSPVPITFTNPTGGNADQIAAKDLLVANREFIRSETVAWIQLQIDSNVAPFSTAFNYDRIRCARDVGYIVDALCYDILYGGNSATRVCAQAYFTGAGASVISGETSQSVAAFNHMSVIAQSIIQGIQVTATPGTVGYQIQLPAVATTTEAGTLSTLVGIITGVITAGNLTGLPAIANPSITWADGAIQSAVGALSSGKTTLINNTISYINTTFAAGTFMIGLDKPTVGLGINATLYFGKTSVYPKLDAEFTTQESRDWSQRMVDPNGSMGGSLVDGSVVSERSPINSFVYDAFTQVNQGGRGIHIINNGYAQLVSVFTIFCSTAVEVNNGGIASITNSNSNFGNICLVAKGKGKLEFSGTVYNPIYPTFEESGGQTVNGQYYPNGYWPQNAQFLAFIPDTAQRPHIGLVMEVVPPEYVLTETSPGVFAETPYINEQGLPGFLAAAPNVATLTTGTIKINGINTDGIAIGHTVYVRDQYGSFVDGAGVRYAATGTVVTDVNYESITLNVALPSGGGDITNSNFFTLLFSGNAYYNVLSSNTATNPVTVGQTVIPGAGQMGAELDAIQFMSGIVQNVVANNSIIPLQYSVIQDKSRASGTASNSFISDRFNEIYNIIDLGTGVAPAIRKTGTPPPEASQAVAQIRANKNFIIAEVTQRVINQGIFVMTAEQMYKCKRDTGLILDKLIQDLTTGGNYNSVLSGLSYYSRTGTHHIISLEDQVRNPLLFPDGATLNFYQRSYMSALGYTFEYVGAGIQYGALPQVGKADPVQGKEVVQIDSGKVFFTSTDQNGDFRIGPGLVISQATGVLSGRTFTKSLFAQMTPFILAVEV